MNISEKVKILGESGKWDTCASSASRREVKGNDRIGNVAAGGICHAFTEDGRCISLFKTLMTNSCTHDCKYCANSTRCEKKVIASYEPEELANVFMSLYTRNHVEGLFLSSGIFKDANYTTERMIKAVEIIRNKFKFQGYIHFKVLPGANRDLIKYASSFADRMSINIEAPSRSRLKEMSDIKDFNIDILRRQAWIKRLKLNAGQTTQLVVGGSDETDFEILKMIDWEYRNMSLKRAYYSAFTPVEKTPFERKEKTPLAREHRLYQVDFMMRKYGIKLKEFEGVMKGENLPEGDPKVFLAKEFFDRPVDVNNASEEELIRVPGIGPLGLRRIIDLRKRGITITKRAELHSMGIVLKRAEPFLKINGSCQRTLEVFQ